MSKDIEVLPPETTAITIAPEVVRDPVATYLLSLQSKESRRTQLNALRYVAGLLGMADPRAVPWSSVAYAHALAVRNALAEKLAPATAQRYYAAFKGTVHEAWRLRLLSTEEWERIRDVKAPSGSKSEKGRALSAQEIRALFDATGDHYRGRRDAALVAVSIFAGLRRFEAAGASFENYDATTGELRVKGKGNKERVVFVAKLAQHHLRRWIEVRGNAPGPLLYGHAKGVGIGYSTVDTVLGRVAKKAGIARFTPHDLRRTFVTRILEATGDLRLAQVAAGHANIDTTTRYDKRKSEAVKNATSKLDVGLYEEGKP